MLSSSLHVGSLLLGALVGAGTLYAYQAYTGAPTTANGAPAAIGAPKDLLHGRIVPGPTAQPAPGPARPGVAPRAGVATVLPYEWAYVVGDGDSAGSIAAAITGDDSRYVELLLANPGLAAVGEPGLYFGGSAWDFAPGALAPGVVLLLPVPWDRFVDQLGRARGGPIPWPADGSGVREDLVGAIEHAIGGAPGYGAPLPPAAVLSTPLGGLAGAPVGTGGQAQGAPDNGGGANQHVQRTGAVERYTPPNPFYDAQGRWKGARGQPAPRMMPVVPQGPVPYGAAFVPGGVS